MTAVRHVALSFGSTQKVISANIRKLRAAGVPEKDAQHVAYQYASRSGRRPRRKNA